MRLRWHEVAVPFVTLQSMILWINDLDEYDLSCEMSEWLTENVGDRNHAWRAAFDDRPDVRLNLSIWFQDKAKGALFKLFWC